MARIPKPVPGLVFRYDYLRPWESERNIEHGKERPACILMVLRLGDLIRGLTAVDEVNGQITMDFTARSGDVIVLSIQSDPPGENQIGIELSEDVKRHVGMPFDKPWYVLVSEVNINAWSRSGMTPVRNATGEWAYPNPLPPSVFARVVKGFLEVRQRRQVPAVVRVP